MYESLECDWCGYRTDKISSRNDTGDAVLCEECATILSETTDKVMLSRYKLRQRAQARRGDKHAD